MKVDIQGHEIRVFNEQTAGKFFDEIKVPVILLEWVIYTKEYHSDLNKRKQVDDWLKFFYKRNYSVHHSETGKNLDRIGRSGHTM